jgi:predicted Rdx family selenoprotein
VAAEIAGGRQNEVNITLTPSGVGGTFEVLLDGKEVFNRKSLASNGAIPDPKLVKEAGQQIRGQLMAALDKATAGAAR